MTATAGGGLLLAFDTSSSLGSVAVAASGGEEVVARRFLPDRGKHGSQLVPLIREALESAGRELRDLSGIVVGTGPGSFTGIRVSAATAKGLVHGLGVPLWPVSSLAAAAASAGLHLPVAHEPDPDDAPLEELSPQDRIRPRYVLFDARADRVYAACYRFRDSGLEVVVPPRPARIQDVLEEGAPPGTFFCGEGALRHAGALQAAGHPVLAPPVGIPTAEGLLRVHVALGERAPEPAPGVWEPDYLRSWKAGRFGTEAVG